MKLNKYIGLALMPMLFAACQNDTLGEEIQQQNGIYTLSGKMAGGAAMSRAQVMLGNTDGSRESFMWNEGDAFALYQEDNNGITQHVFTISADYSETGEGDKKSATFTTDNPAQAMKYVAVYPANTYVNEGDDVEFGFQTYLDFTQTTNAEERAEVWKEYMKNNMFMMAEGSLNGDGVNTVSFRHLTSLARITYTNSTDKVQKITGIRLGGDQSFGTHQNYDLHHGGQTSGGSTNGYELWTEGLTVEAGETADFYMFFFPEVFWNMDNCMHLSIIDRNHLELPVAQISVANGGVDRFEAGKRYWFKVTEYDNGMVWSKDFTTEVATIENPQLAMALQSYLGSDMVIVNADSTATISLMDARSIEYLNFNRDGIKLSSLDGLEIFSNLKELNADNVGLEGSFDASVFAKLEKLELQNNHLTVLNVKGCSKLNWLTFENNMVKEIDLSECPKLDVFNCGYNLLTSLDLSANKNITWLGCEDNLLTALDLSMMETDGGYFLLGGQGESTGDNLTITIKMTDAWKEAWYNLLNDGYNSRRVIIEGEVTPAEDEVMIASTGFATALYNVLGSDKVTLTETGRGIMKKEVVEGITELNLNGQKGVTSLSGLNHFVNLKRLTADTVDLEGDLDFSQNPAIEYLDLSRNPGITSIWVRENPNLTDLYLVSSPIQKLDVTKNPNLKSLLLVDSKVSYLDMSQNPQLYHLNCRANYISELDVTANSELKQLYCGGQYDGITIKVTMTSEHKVWWDESFSNRWENERVEVYVHDANYLTIKNPEFSAALKRLFDSKVILDGNGYAQMTEDDVLNVTILDFGADGSYTIPSFAGIELFKNLTFLQASNADVLECNLSQNTKLQHVYLRYNDLKSLDLNNSPELVALDIDGNENLTSLNIDNCMHLDYLHILQTGLTSVNIQNKENIVYLGYDVTNLPLDLTEFTSVKYLNVFDSDLTSLDFVPASIKGQLIEFDFGCNQITSIDLKGYSNLEVLRCEMNPLTTLQLDLVQTLKELMCYNCKIESLDLTVLPNLERIYCGEQVNDIKLILKVTEGQKSKWHNQWKYDYSNNVRVYLEGEEPSDEGNGSLGNFGTGGEF